MGNCDIFSRADRYLLWLPIHKTREPSIYDAFKFCGRKYIIHCQGNLEKLELNDLTVSCLWQWNKVVHMQDTKAYGGQDV